jgi:hypothetical protein
MIAMHKELAISVDDIGAISIECDGRHSQIRMQIDAKLAGQEMYLH